jgi:LuxR family glucitol operon transcriptional activator
MVSHFYPDKSGNAFPSSSAISSQGPNFTADCTKKRQDIFPSIRSQIMENPLDIIKQFVPYHKQVEIQDRMIDTLARAFPDERWRKLIQAYRSDAAFQDSLTIALKRAVQKFALAYEDKELVEAITHSPHFWDIPSIKSALQEIVTRPSSYLQPERKVLLHSFADVLPTMEQERAERAVYFFLHCLTEEVITIPQLAPIYQVQFQWASLEQSHQLIGLQRDHNQLMTMLIETVTQNQLRLAAPPTPALPKVHDNLPPQHGEFLGREKDVERVLNGLRSRWPLVSIEGLGGMGKTTLAIETARSCLRGPQAVLDPPFEYVVWVSAKDKPEQKLWLNEVLDTTARILGYPSLMKLSLEQIEQKKGEVSQLLHSYRTLLIIDNFETIDDRALESWMQDIPDPSKVLITSRTSQLRSTRPITLKGLEDPAAVALIRNSAGSLGLESLETASEATLLPLVRVTGGNPKAIEIALGYIKRGRLSLNEVIEHLHVAGKTVNNVFDDLFVRVWNVMTEDTQYVLLVSPFFADYASKEALGAAAGLTEYHLDNAVEELVELKLLDIKEEAVVLNQRYSMHPLTRAFASAQLRERPDFEAQARMRWSNYYLDFATRRLTRDEFKEPYWNALPPYNRELIDPEWPNLQEVLAWADQQGQDRILIELTLLLAHYMCARMQFPARLYYAQKAAEAASRLGRKEDAALFHIDARGWVLLEVGRLTDGIEEITTGLHIAQTLDTSSTDATNLIALANTWLAMAFLEQGDLAKASALMDEFVSLECKPVIQCRVSMIAGDIAYKKKNAEAMRLYESARQISRSIIWYGGEGVDARLGNLYLDSGNLIQAEACFNQAWDRQQHFGIDEIPYAKYGLARVALAKGERDKARQIAQEVQDVLLRTCPSHKLLKEIPNFLKSLAE